MRRPPIGMEAVDPETKYRASVPNTVSIRQMLYVLLLLYLDRIEYFALPARSSSLKALMPRQGEPSRPSGVLLGFLPS